MRKIVCIALFALLAVSTVAAAPAAKPKAGTASDFAFIFDLQNLLLAIEEFDDGYQAGVGLKYWAVDVLAVRALANFNLNSNEDVTTTNLGISAGAEWHPLKKKVSPYLGGFLGLRTTSQTGAEGRIDFYLGGIGGAEIVVWENLSFYAEYNLLVSNDINGWTVSLGGAKSAQLGLLVYF